MKIIFIHNGDFFSKEIQSLLKNENHTVVNALMHKRTGHPYIPYDVKLSIVYCATDETLGIQYCKMIGRKFKEPNIFLIVIHPKENDRKSVSMSLETGVVKNDSASTDLNFCKTESKTSKSGWRVTKRKKLNRRSCQFARIVRKYKNYRIMGCSWVCLYQRIF